MPDDVRSPSSSAAVSAAQTIVDVSRPTTADKQASPLINVDYFDPSGVEELRRTLTNKSKKHADANADVESATDSNSDLTIAIGSDGQLDLEKTVRQIVKKYVFVI